MFFFWLRSSTRGLYLRPDSPLIYISLVSQHPNRPSVVPGRAPAKGSWASPSEAGGRVGEVPCRNEFGSRWSPMWGRSWSCLGWMAMHLVIFQSTRSQAVSEESSDESSGGSSIERWKLLRGM